MQEKLTIIDVPCNRQPLGLLTSQSACSPSGRPYSPYPYRDLPKTPSEWPSSALNNTKFTPSSTQKSHGGNFHLFSYLPAELRLQIWREAMLSACSHGRVHRIRLAISSSEPDTPEEGNDNSNNSIPQPNPKPTLHILPTPHLSASTRATRALLASCSEARYELLSLNNPNPNPTTTPTITPTITSTTLPHTLPLSSPNDNTPTGLLRLNLTRDLLLIEDLSSALLFALADARHACGPALLAPLRAARHLGLDVAPLLDEAAGCAFLFPGAAVSPEVERGDGEVVGGEVQGQGCVFAGGDGDGVGVGREWYTTSPFPSYYVDGEYYSRLTKTMRFLCQFRQAMDAPAVVTDLDDEAGLERLEDVKLRLLGHYVTREDGAEAEGLELSSPERCLEYALGKEPRWVQWEWVCQCLDC
ncbi:hypothetical protein B0I37DRAFT_421464 [Chaetomium sp. MPI-CAGE-AT-0009]|nr:hypothetical protein B0I37DRAFT_421464 [Chaetomium sp. MPI-CAGE-AT-0009]